MKTTSFFDRAARARDLARIRSEASEVLSFYADVALFQSEVDPERPLESLPRLIRLVEEAGPDRLKAEARALDEDRCRAAMRAYRALEETQSPRSFFARVLLQAVPPEGPAGELEGACPRCGHPPQVGCLRPHEHGSSFSLVCSLCFSEWASARGRCCGCGGRVEYHEAPELPHLRVQVCGSCRRYLHVLRMDVEPRAIPEVDELSALSLDVWARGEGYEKIFPNLAGI